ncbi:MAG: hypothetical protein ACREAD_03675 [Nitrosopumilaceae archaeon]
MVNVQRGWKTIKTPIAEGMRINYNFVKPQYGFGWQNSCSRGGFEFNQRERKQMDGFIGVGIE